MMKKTVSLFVAVSMLFGACALAQTQTVAENVEKFDLTVDVPEGATYEDVSSDGEFSIATIKVPGADDCNMMYDIVIAPTEEYAEDVTMNDLDETSIEALYKIMAAELEQPSYEIRELTSGRKVMIVNEGATQSDFCYIISVHNGYFIQMTVMHDDFAVLTEDEINNAFAVFDTIVVTDK